MSHWEANGKSDEWYTPRYIFDALGCKFDTDVAAPWPLKHCNVPADHFIHQKSLEMDWSDLGFVWMNPPFGARNSIGKWLDKIAEHGNGIALTPDRTSAAWWQKAAIESDAILFINGKVKFIRPDGSHGNSPSTGTCLFAYGYKAVRALRKAKWNGLGFLFKK